MKPPDRLVHKVLVTMHSSNNRQKKKNEGRNKKPSAPNYGCIATEYQNMNRTDGCKLKNNTKKKVEKQNREQQHT